MSNMVQMKLLPTKLRKSISLPIGRMEEWKRFNGSVTMPKSSREKLSSRESSAKFLKRFQKETTLLNHLVHPRINDLVGFYYRNDTTCLPILPFADETLQSFLSSKRKSKSGNVATANQILNWETDLASAWQPSMAQEVFTGT